MYEQEQQRWQHQVPKNQLNDTKNSSKKTTSYYMFMHIDILVNPLYYRMSFMYIRINNFWIYVMNKKINRDKDISNKTEYAISLFLICGHQCS